ncbi:hypothetical protein NEOLI_004255 [Neolecta irregularis DAH-3]|uniref:Uncharacterized protein n=1 Tax=Neolecta irregularis (strain DAH-3) TaxID=1198029 RepID=A0A1U7LU47_NEOID|nr:hypothetical protein NEOLI_004255 [Neolecta irregularis DAH-3]|eukprot:OLL26041.1 hypothetical protein NEOLI_004255 [Neolecta irregularis DAH-3]
MVKFSFAGPSLVLNTRREQVHASDIIIATLTFGWTCGFGHFVLWHVIKQTQRTEKFNLYIFMCWAEYAVCAIFAVICWLHILGVIPPSFIFFFSILTCWALQVQFLLQIIVNRLCILQRNNQKRILLKAGVATLITAVNITVYCIWVPARLNISAKYIAINAVWDRCEKSIYLIVDGLLNYYFVRTTCASLLSLGLTKYDSLVRFNKRIIFISLSMDVLIIAMMSYPNDFVYMQFHPVAYLVKLNIEMAMSDLMVRIAAEGKDNVFRSKHHADQKDGKFVVLEQTAVKIGYDTRKVKHEFSTCDIYGMDSHHHLYTATVSAKNNSTT